MTTPAIPSPMIVDKPSPVPTTIYRMQRVLLGTVVSLWTGFYSCHGSNSLRRDRMSSLAHHQFSSPRFDGLKLTTEDVNDRYVGKFEM